MDGLFRGGGRKNSQTAKKRAEGLAKYRKTRQDGWGVVFLLAGPGKHADMFRPGSPGPGVQKKGKSGSQEAGHHARMREKPKSQKKEKVRQGGNGWRQQRLLHRMEWPFFQ